MHRCPLTYQAVKPNRQIPASLAATALLARRRALTLRRWPDLKSDHGRQALDK